MSKESPIDRQTARLDGGRLMNSRRERESEIDGLINTWIAGARQADG